MATHAVEASPSSETSSHVRTREGARDAARAERRVSEYLRALGLGDTARVEALAREIHAACEPAQSVELAAERAVAAAQARYAQFLDALFGTRAIDVDALWLRAFIAAEPQVFLGDVEQARSAVARFGEPWTFQAPLQARFKEQALARIELPRWLKYSLVPAALTLSATTMLAVALARDGLGWLEAAWLIAFWFLCALGSVGAWIAVLGLRSMPTPSVSVLAPRGASLPRSVVCMPIYEEDAERVFAAVSAMREALDAVEGGDAFEIFVLSDSRRTLQAAEEERAFRRIAANRSKIPVYYRRRARNTRHKAGNLAEFFERWGERYTYAVVLDADSLMTGDTLVALTRRMHVQPRLALLQAPIALHGGSTLFSRAQQFAASVCGPLFMRGLSRWAGPHGNYYGHNAVLRVRAFMDCCALPTLAGAPPLGGDILSHDFVEAALLCRAGWEVRMAEDLDGSWEESPPTLQDHVARDRRWCQGNLQHLRIACSEGLSSMSRLHMLLGAGCYLAGPVWLAFMLLSVCIGAGAALPVEVSIALCLLTAAFLLGPRALGVYGTWRERRSRAAHGGSTRLITSAVLELLLAASTTPLLMLHHTRIVFSIFSGKHVRWGRQQRRARGAFASLVRAELPTTALGVLGVAGLYAWAPTYLAWLAPLWVPWLCAIPISHAMASSHLGRGLRRSGLLMVPSEGKPHELVARVAELRAFTGTDDSARFRDLVLDPLLVHAHVAELRSHARPALASTERLSRLRDRVLRMGPAALTRDERDALASDATSMYWLHREAWRHWPVESWNLARDLPQLPPEPAH